MNAITLDSPVLEIIDGHPTTLSTKVASFFVKRHDNVIRDIRRIIEKYPEIGVLNFEESSYIDGQGNTRPCYRMNRKGFVLLAMGFTGIEALKFKNDYIDAFDRMEAELRSKEAQGAAWITHHMVYEIHQAVSKRAGKDYLRHELAYKAIKEHFKIERCDQLPPHRLEECLKLIENTDLTRLEADNEEKKKEVVLTRKEAERLRAFIYYWKYKYRPLLELANRFLNGVDAPIGPEFHDMTYSTSLNDIEITLEKYGYPMADLPAYQGLMRRRARQMTMSNGQVITFPEQ